MGLRTYHRKRDFEQTPEPRGGTVTRTRTGRSFVVQKHAASRLHYDFRLELDGVLLSWAVPKGPSLDPAERRLAMRTEDHPLEYGGFEGVIPKGQYGGGTVVVWDRGAWEPVGDARRGLRKGALKFRLHGERLEGGWTLVRMDGRGEADERAWLLVKEKDAHAQPGDGAGLVEAETTSVATGRSLEEVAAARDRVWDSSKGELPRKAPPRPPRKARKGALPTAVEPQLATLVDAPPEGADWIHELKFDGYRVLARVGRPRNGRAREVRLLTRKGKDWTARFGPVADALAALPAREALLDGELCVVRDDGVTDFQELQNALGEGRAEQLAYFAFDLLHLDGRDLRPAPLLERKEALRTLLAALPDPRVRYSDHVEGRGGEFFETACRAGVEGVVSKRADRPYASGRGRDWLKARCGRGQEVVVVGWTDPAGARTGFGALVVAVHDGEGGLRYAGKVGTGFDDRTLADLAQRLAPLERKTPTVVDPPRGAAARGIHWVEPRLVAEVGFTEWTRDGKLRHPSFKGLRQDKPAKEVVREVPEPVEAAKRERPPRGRKPARRRAGGSGDDDGEAVVAGVRLSSPERVLYPGQGVTKLELARYYEAVGERFLREVKDRPLTLVRCPTGRGGECFYQKHVRDSTPDAVRPVAIRDSDKTAQYISVHDLRGVVALVQVGVLEFHPWGSRADRVDAPDRMIFDLDPDVGLPWRRTTELAFLVRDRLADLGLRSFLKTTGGKGLHVVVPLVRRHGFDDIKAFSKAVAEEFAREMPDRVTSVQSKARRKGRIYLDYLRNGRGSTAVAAYSTRAREGAPVALPIAWEELDEDLRPGEISLAEVVERVESGEDAWRDMDSVRQSLTKRMLAELGLA